MRKALADRFWEKVDIQGPDDCWEWTAGKIKGGYGRLQVDGSRRMATHVLFYIRQGYWPPQGRTANHHCDNSPCLNPKHLYLGTQKSNIYDMVQRGRARGGNGGLQGELCGRAKLTDEEVRIIKRLLTHEGITQKELAFRFGVSKPIISRIKTGKIWRHV